MVHQGDCLRKRRAAEPDTYLAILKHQGDVLAHEPSDTRVLALAALRDHTCLDNRCKEAPEMSCCTWSLTLKGYRPGYEQQRLKWTFAAAHVYTG